MGTATSLAVKATDTAGGTLSYTATGLPAGLTLNTATGVISGTPTTAATSTVTVTATDSTGPSGQTSFTWTISGTGGGCTAAQLLGNPGFETGTAPPWSTSTSVIYHGTQQTPRTGSYDAWLDGYGTTHTDTLSQQVSIPAGCTTATLSYWLHVDTAETSTSSAYDKLTLSVAGDTLASYSNLNAATGYTQHTVTLSGYPGQTVTLLFTGTEDYTAQTSFVLDDTALTVG